MTFFKFKQVLHAQVWDIFGVIRFSHRCVGPHEPTSSSRPNKIRICSGSFLGDFEVRLVFLKKVRRT
jgi:hypothetical protein